MRYSQNEVKSLVNSYQALREKKGVHGVGLLVLVKLTDLMKAVERMPPKEYHAVLLHGLLGIGLHEAGLSLGVSASTVHDRYNAGLTWITRFLNYGEEGI